MDSKIQSGYLLLADISGFTSFMADSELDHAQPILHRLLNFLVEKSMNAFAPYR